MVCGGELQMHAKRYLHGNSADCTATASASRMRVLPSVPSAPARPQTPGRRALNGPEAAHAGKYPERVLKCRAIKCYCEKNLLASNMC